MYSGHGPYVDRYTTILTRRRKRKRKTRDALIRKLEKGTKKAIRTVRKEAANGNMTAARLLLERVLPMERVLHDGIEDKIAELEDMIDFLETAYVLGELPTADSTAVASNPGLPTGSTEKSSEIDAKYV